MMKQILLHISATIANVGPGYDIFGLTLENPYDELKITLNNSKSINIEIIDDNENIPVEIRDNTAGLAALELFKRMNINQGVNIEIIKRKIPSGCGLGSTGASASATIYGLNKLLNLALSDNEIIDIARFGEVASGGSPHADNVAAALLGGFVLIKSYNPMDVIKLQIPEFPVVLAVIRKSQRTTRGFITYEIGEKKLKDQISRCSTVIHAIHTEDIEEFGRTISVDHIAEPVRSTSIPDYQNIKNKILSAGAWGCNICGGGSSVFALCDENKVVEIANLMQKKFSTNPNFIGIIKTKVSNKGIQVIDK